MVECVDECSANDAESSCSNNRKALEQSLHLPESFYIGQAAGLGDCFYDSVAQGLTQIRPEQVFTIKSLRKVCKKFAERSLKNDGAKWFHDNIAYEVAANGELPLDRYINDIEYTAAECKDVPGLQNGPIWGRPEIEGRILCEEYDFKLHVAERHEGLDLWTHDTVSATTGSVSVAAKYEDESTVYIINSNGTHFEPILRKNCLPPPKLQHMRDVCDMESMQVDAMLRKLDTVFPAAQNAAIEPDGKESEKTLAGFFDAESIDEDEDSLTAFLRAIRFNNVALVQKLFRKWRLWPFDVYKFEYKTDDAISLFLKLYKALKIEPESLTDEMRNLIEEEVHLRSYLHDIAQLMKSTKSIARESSNGNEDRSEFGDILIFEILRSALLALNSYIYYEEKFPANGETTHLHKLTLLLFSLVEHNFRILVGQIDKLGLQLRIVGKMRECLGLILIPMINYEQMKNLEENISRLQIGFIQRAYDFENPNANARKCDLLLKRIQDWCEAHKFGKPKMGFVMQLRDCFGSFQKRIQAARSVIRDPENIPENTSSLDILTLIKERVILDNLLRDVQFVQFFEPQNLSKYVLKRILQVSDQSSYRDKLKFLPKLSKTYARLSSLDVWEKQTVISTSFFEDLKEMHAEVLDASKQIYEQIMQFYEITIKRFFKDFDTTKQSQEQLEHPHENDISNCLVNGEDLVTNVKDQMESPNAFVESNYEFYKICSEIEHLNNLAKSRRRLFESSVRRNPNFDKCSPLSCSSFITVTTHSEIYLTPRETANSKPVAMSETPPESVEEIVDRLIKIVLDDLLNKTSGKTQPEISNEAYSEFRNRIEVDEQINRAKLDLQTFCGTTEHNISECEQGRPELNTSKENSENSEIVKLTENFEKLAMVKVTEALKGQLNNIFLETLAHLKYVIGDCANAEELLRRCQYNDLVRSSIEMLIWELIKIIKSAASPPVYSQLENMLQISMERLLPSPFLSISVFDYLTPGNILRTFNPDDLRTTIFLAWILAIEGEMLLVVKNVLEMNGGREFLLNSLRTSIDGYAIEKPVSKFDELIDVIRSSEKWNNDVWTRDLVRILKNQVAEAEGKTVHEYIWHVFEAEVFDVNNFQNLEFWRSRVNIATIKDPRGKTLLHSAAAICDAEMVEVLLRMGFDANAVDDCQNTPLHIAAFFDNIDIVETLIECTAKLDGVNNCHFTPLHIAVSCGRAKIAEKLLDNGVDIEATTRNGFTPLFFALPHARVVQLLLDRKANVNARNRENSTPLHEAARFAYKDSLKLLLTNGSKLQVTDNSCGTPLHTSVLEGHSDAFRTLLHHGGDIFDVCRSKCTLVHHAAYGGHLDILQDLIEKGLFIDGIDDCGMTPLHLAAIGGHQATVELLLAHMPKPIFVDCIDAKRRTALHYASGGVSHVLIWHGASVNAVDCGGETPLHFAARCGSIETVKALVEEGADIGVEDHQGLTPLAIASQLGFEDDFFSLLKANLGDNIDKTEEILPISTAISSKDGREGKVVVCSEKGSSDGLGHWSPIHIAVINNDVDALVSLVNDGFVDSLGANNITPLQLAAEVGYVGCVEVLAKSGADVNATCGFHGRTALHFAAYRGHATVVQKLIDAGGDVNSRDEYGNAAIHLASEQGEIACVEILLENGADVHCRNSAESTPLHVAAFKGHDELIKVLAEMASVDGVDANGCTPLFLAVRENHIAAVNTLLASGATISRSNDEKLAPLHVAALNDNVAVVKKLLDFRSNVNISGPEGQCPLHLAASKGNLKVTKLLLARGADVNAPSRHNRTPLHVASESGNGTIVRYLISRSAAPDVPDDDDLTSLFLAIQNGHTRVVRILIEAGANVNFYCGNYDITPMYAAIASRRLDVMQILIRGGAKVNIHTKNHITPLWYAAFIGYPEAVEVLLENGANLNAADKQNNTALHISARSYVNLKVVSILLQKKANVDVLNNKNWTPLHEAIESGCSEIVASLLAGGASVGVPFEKGILPLHLAARQGDATIVQLLLEHGADPNAPDFENLRTPLHHAVQCGHSDVVALLVEKGSNINAVDSASLSPLFLAVEIQNAPLVGFLLGHGADVNIQDDNSTTPLMVAVRSDIGDAIIQALLDAGAEVNASTHEAGLTPLHLAISENSREAVGTLLRNGADVNSRNKTGATPLHVAARLGHHHFVQILINNFADVNAATDEGLKPLHDAAGEGHIDVVTCLLDHGADVNAAMRDNWRPIHFAAAEGHSGVIITLLNHGANVDDALKGGKTALYLAADRGHVETVRTLLHHKADARLRTTTGLTMLHAAVASNDFEIIWLILKSLDESGRMTFIETPDNRGNTAFILAARLNKNMSVETLLRNGANVNVRNNQGFTGMHYAVQGGDADMVGLILKHDDSKNLVNFVNDNGDSALHLAILFNRAQVVATLINEGADVRAVNGNHFTPVHLAAEKGYEDVIEILQKNGADINAMNDEEFYTPLHLAAMEGHAKAVRILVQCGAVLDHRLNGYDITPLYLAVQNGHAKVAKILLEYGASATCARNPATILHASVCGKNVEIINLLISKISNEELSLEPFINAVDYAGDTPLMWAAQGGIYNVVQVLLNFGASVQMKNEKQMTALHWAAKNGHAEVVKLLLRHRSKRDSQDIDGSTPLYLAMVGQEANCSNDYEAVIRLLQSRK